MAGVAKSLQDRLWSGRGQSLVVWAIREGREVAREVDESLMGYSYLAAQ